MLIILSFFKDDLGVTAIEYALIGSVIAVVIAAAVAAIGSALIPTFTTLASKV